MDKIISVIEKMIDETPNLVIFKLTAQQARDLHAWLTKYHAHSVPDMASWLGKNPSFMGRKIEIYDLPKDPG